MGTSMLLVSESKRIEVIQLFGAGIIDKYEARIMLMIDNAPEVPPKE